MLVNPCFDGEHNGDPTYWQQTAGWDVSAIKNPCGSNGTAARINDPEQHGEYQLGDDERIWQVVDGAGPSLTAEIACVHHSSTVFADTNIYGGASGDGPWLLVWTPFTKETCSKNQWGGVQHAETVLPVAFPFYKFELAAMYTEEIGAVKFTSAYFRSE